MITENLEVNESLPSNFGNMQLLKLQGSQRTNTKKLDPIPSELVGRARVIWLSQAEKYRREPWCTLLWSTICPTVIEGWCGWTDSAWAEMKREEISRSSNVEYLAHVNELTSSIFAEVKHSDKTPRIYASYFEVDKTETLSRAILNCKTLNIKVSRPPSLSLPSLEDIFALVSFFPRSSAVCTADFRHYFYQIPLPSIVRHLFSVQCKSVLAELKAFAMGFSWSPFVAQGLAMTVARRGIENVGMSPESPHPFSDALPRFWIVRHQQKISGFVVFWYDNLLVIGKNRWVAQNLVAGIRRECDSDHSNLIWKSVEENDPFNFQSPASLSYLGLQFCVEDANNVKWKHADANILSWKRSHELLTWRNVAKMIGILIWDWSVANRSRSEIELVIEAARKIGNLQLEGRLWDFTHTLTQEHVVSLEILWSATMQNPWNVRCTKEIQFTTEIFLASDAMKSQGAAVRILAPGVASEVRTWALNPELHINIKETQTALEALEWVLPSLKPGSLVRLGVDNSTALTALKHRIFIASWEVQKWVDDLHKRYRDRNCDWIGIYVPGVDHAADSPSRGGPVLQSYVTKTFSWLKEAEIFSSLKKRLRDQ